jgi:hypothetical protein
VVGREAVVVEIVDVAGAAFTSRTNSSMARSIGMAATPSFWFTQR